MKKQRLVFGTLLMLIAHGAAATHVNWEFGAGGSAATQSGSGIGNSIEFNENGHEVEVRAYGDDINGMGGTLSNGQVLQSASGLGACNASEGVNCGDPEHQVDNVGFEDWVLFILDGRYHLDSITIDPSGSWDRDVSFWIGRGDASAGFAGLNLATLGNPVTRWADGGSSSLTVNLGSTGTWLLFGAYHYDVSTTQNYEDRFEIVGLTGQYLGPAAVPEPGTLGLLALGLLGISAFRRSGFRHAV